MSEYLDRINEANDIKKIENSKVDYSKIITYYRRKLVDYGVIRELKNSYKSEGKFIKAKEFDLFYIK